MQTTSQTQGGDAIEILLNDHTTIKQLLARLVQARETQQRSQVLEQLKGLLTLHNAVEEALVYPALNAIAHKKSESMKLYNETAEADVLLFEIDTMLKTGAAEEVEAKVKKFQEAVLEHIQDEEEKAFPHLRNGADSSQQEMLTQSVREFRQKFVSGNLLPRTTMGEVER